MKYLTIGICILAVILCLCLLFAYLSDQYLDETEALLREAAQYFPAEDYDSILPLATEAQETWESHKGFFSSILSHSELEEVNYCFASMTAYARYGEMAELCDAYSRLLSMMEHLRSMDRPHYYNILSPIVNQFKFKG